MAAVKKLFVYCCLLLAFFSSNAQHIDSMSNAFSRMTSSKQKAALALEIAGGYLQQRSIDSCLPYLNNALSTGQQLHDDSIVMESENLLGMAMASQRKFDVAVEHYKKAIALSDNLHLPGRKVNVMYHEVEAIREGGDLDRSFALCKDALELATSIKDMKSVAKFYTVMARYYKSKGQLGLAVDCLSRCVHLNDSLKNYADMAFSYGKIAGIYSSQGDMKNAIKFSLLADSIYTKIGDERGRNYNYIDMSSFYNIMGDFRNGVDVALKAQKYFANDTDQYMLIYGNLASLYSGMNNYKEAKKYFHLCSYFNSLLFHNDIAALDINNTLAMIFFEEKNLDSAFYFATLIPWDNDLSKVVKGRMNQYKDRIYILTKIYIAKGDKKNAGEYFERYTACRDSIDQQTNEDYRAEAETKLNIAEKDRALKSMATENELQKLKAQKDRNANLFLISFLILGAIVIAVLLRTYVIQKKSNVLKEQLLGQKEALLGQKDILMKEIHHRVKNNLQVISTLLDLQLDNIKDASAQKAITEGMSRIRSISLIHQQLYQHDDMTSIEFSKFAKDLLHQVTVAFKKPGQDVALQNEIPEIFLDIDTAVPLGLMLNELMTNSYKYAFGDNAVGSIHVRLENKTDHYELIYGDSGPGMPPGFDLATSTSLGIMVIDSLSKQLGGRMVYDDVNKQFVIQFKDIAGRKRTA